MRTGPILAPWRWCWARRSWASPRLSRCSRRGWLSKRRIRRSCGSAASTRSSVSRRARSRPGRAWIEAWRRGRPDAGDRGSLRALSVSSAANPRRAPRRRAAPAPRAGRRAASRGRLPGPTGRARRGRATDAAASRQSQVNTVGGPESRGLRRARSQSQPAPPPPSRLDQASVRTASPAIRVLSPGRKKAAWPGVWPGVGTTVQSGRPGTPAPRSKGRTAAPRSLPRTSASMARRGSTRPSQRTRGSG